MPVTIYPAKHPAETYTARNYKQATSPESLLQGTLTDDGGKLSSAPKALVKSSFEHLSSSSPSSSFSSAIDGGGGGGGGRVYASKNGFVHGCIAAYNHHQHLVIRPDDVWFAILTQLSVYVDAHAESLRPVLVAHDGVKDLVIEDDNLRGDPATWDHGRLAHGMTKLMEANLADAAWRDWILPAFSTTTKVDQAAASVVFMGTLQRYFTYSWGSRCGLPSVTLLGQRSDWERILARCEDRLPLLLGKEVERWLTRTLRPVLRGFVETFRNPGRGDDNDDGGVGRGRGAVDFWSRIVNEHRPNGSGTTRYSGWITAFCYWDQGANCIHDIDSNNGRDGGGGGGVRITMSDIPAGFTKVPVTLLVEGTRIPTEMVAGSLGFTVSDSKKPDPKTGKVAGLDTIQPEIGWLMYRI